MKVYVMSTILFLINCFGKIANAQQTGNTIYTDTIPLGGNAWVKEPALITNDGLIQWSDASTVVAIYFSADVVQNFNLLLRLKVPDGKSEISVTSGNNKFNKQISNTNFEVV